MPPLRSALRPRRNQFSFASLLHQKRNRFVTLFVSEAQKAETEMTSLRAAFLLFAMLTAITAWGVAIYTADAASGHLVVDGYGVTGPAPH
jgi:hypothetical protein